MTRAEFLARYKAYFVDKTEVPQLEADLEALIDRAQAEARRVALAEAEACACDVGSRFVGDAIHAISRWDGRTPFVPEVKR